MYIQLRSDTYLIDISMDISRKINILINDLRSFINNPGHLSTQVIDKYTGLFINNLGD
jgi:hypothetical protein